MSSSSKKRKLVEEDTVSVPLCIVHYAGSSNEQFIPCSSEMYLRLKDICTQRLAEPISSSARMTDVCIPFPSTFSQDHGYHRDCYQRFTMNLSRLTALKADVESEISTPVQCRSRRSSEPERVIFKPDCIFCGKVGKKNIRKKGMRTTEQTTKFEFGGGTAIQQIAEQKQDEVLLTRIRGLDLFACDARFHSSCRLQYLKNPERWRSKDDEARQLQTEVEKVHKNCFEVVTAFVDSAIIGKKQVAKLSDLRELYVNKLASTKFANQDYRSENLKANLQKQYGDHLQFINIGKPGKFGTYLIINSETNVESAVKLAYDLGNIDTITETAKMLRTDIYDAYENSDNLQWPPTAQYLSTGVNSHLPYNLERFLVTLLLGKESKAPSEKVSRLINSLGQDLCRATTHGRWKLPKHIILSMALRHWFRSAELTTILNRFGHSESYSFSLELETAIAMAVENTSTLLSPQIVRHPDVTFIFHSDFDNYDQLLNDICGMASIHTSHGIMLQDFSCPSDQEVGGQLPVVSSVNKTGIRSLKIETQDVLPDCYVTKRQSPGYNVQQWEVEGSTAVSEFESRANLLWVMARYLSSYLSQELPGFAGFQSLLGDSPARLTTIDYYPVINQPITDNKSVQECLRFSEEGSKEVGQEYVITTFDLGVCMKAFPIIWNQPEKYQKHIVMIGTFHIVCAYLKMVGKKMEGTGLVDILLEAGMIGSGSVNGVMSGKHYSRAMHCHKTVLEVLERLLMDQYSLTVDGEITPMYSLPEDSFDKLKVFVFEPTSQTFEAIAQDPNISSYVDGFVSFRQQVRDGLLGKTAQLWMSYLDHIWLVLQLTKAVKSNNYLLYARCLFLMSDLFFSFGGQNYARYLTFFSVFLANIEQSHPGATHLISRRAISVARSFIPGNRCPVDKTIEETFMKHSKSHGGAGGSSAGLSGLLSNYDSYQRWIRAAHERAQFVKSAVSLADMLPDETKEGLHRDVRPTEIKRSEENVVKTMETIAGFVNPFDTDDRDKLICLSSGAIAGPVIEADVLGAEAKGNAAKISFITDRLEKKEKFFDPIKRLNLKTLSDLNKKTTVKSSQNKILEYRQQSNIAFQLLVRSQCEDLRIDLKELMTYPLTPVPYSIATPDGFLNKTDKSKGYHYLVKNIDSIQPPPDKETLVIEDGNAVFYYLKDLPGNFKDICAKIFDIVVRKSDVIFSTDMYIEKSVKAMERQRRGLGDKLIVKGENTKKPTDWKAFLSNDENKVQLIRMLSRVWNSDTFGPKLVGKKLIAVCEGHAHLLQSSEDGEHVVSQDIDTLESTQEETDSRVVLYCQYGKQQGYNYIRIKSPDTDIFFILLYYALSITNVTILFDTGTGNNKKLINMTRLAEEYGPEKCSALLGLHAFTRCDSTSAFKGIGKVKPIKTLEKHRQFQSIFSLFGQEWDISDELALGTEAFTCLMYGGKVTVTNINELRYIKIREKCCSTRETFDSSKNIDISVLPPCKQTLLQHIRRANCQVGIWKRAHIAKPLFPDPDNNHGWHFSADGVLEPKWMDGDFIPQQLIDVLVHEDVGEENDSESDEEDVLYSLLDESEDEDEI